jgi:phosphonate transport system substrate-binding protein
MDSRTSRRSFLILLFLSGCGIGSRSVQAIQLTVGTVSYGAANSGNQYDRFKQYLAEKLQAVVQVEPAFNERKALERLKAQAWSLVFAPPGLAAIAMSQYQYTPLFPLVGVNNLRSVLVVPKESSASDLQSLAGKRLAIGQPGSATGYYFPIFNLYGLTLKELLVTSTPKAVLEAISQGQADAGALSLEEFNLYKSQLNPAEFRILYNDPHKVPAGVLLVSPSVDRTLLESIRKVLGDTPSVVAEEAGFVPTGTVPDYKYMISVVDRVRAIFPADRAEGTALLAQKPVRLFTDGQPAAPQAASPAPASPIASPASGSPASTPAASPTANSSPAPGSP